MGGVKKNSRKNIGHKNFLLRQGGVASLCVVKIDEKDGVCCVQAIDVFCCNCNIIVL